MLFLPEQQISTVPIRCAMPHRERQTCQRKAISACAITSITLLVGLLIFAVIYLTFRRQDIVGEHSNPDLTYELGDTMYDDCRAKATVVTDKAMKEKWDTLSNVSQDWSNAEQKAAQPVHMYLEKRQSTSIYMYTDVMLQPVKQDLETEAKPKEMFEPRSSLYVCLSEAIQILKHSQVTCLSTNYRTDTLLNLNISDKLIRFSTFILASDGWNDTRKASCFQVYTCFGADITHYSALKQPGQVLIPPYEVFTVTDTETDTPRCKVVYRLKSNLNCVYDRESNTLHSITAMPMDGFWIIFSITCVLIVSLLLPFVIVKVMDNQRKIVHYRNTSLHNSTYSPATVVF